MRTAEKIVSEVFAQCLPLYLRHSNEDREAINVLAYFATEPAKAELLDAKPDDALEAIEDALFHTAKGEIFATAKRALKGG